MSISKREQRKIYRAHKYYVTEREYERIPDHVIKKWSPELKKAVQGFYAKKEKIAKYGSTGTTTRYEAQKHENRIVNHEKIRHLQIKLVPSKTKNWQACFTKRGHTTSASTKTTDQTEAMKFAAAWYKKEVEPTLFNNRIDVLDTVITQFEYLGKSKWNNEEFGFRELPDCPCVGPGVYVFMLGKDIQKIGKADGVKGLRSRLKNYASKNRSRVDGDHKDRFTLKLNETMNSAKLKGKSISVYYFETKLVHTNELGIKVSMTSARQLEKQLSMLARAQDHSMLLSGSD